MSSSAWPLWPLLLFALLLPLRADWLQFRGPEVNHHGDPIPLPSKFTQPTWISKLPGRGISSPIIVDHRLILTAATGPRQNQLHILCFDTTTGHLVWERSFWAIGRTQCHEKTSVATPTSTSDGQFIFATFSSNDLFCLDLDGNLVWLRGLTRDYPNASNSLGMSSSLVVADQTVVVMAENDSESFTAGLDAATGVNRWKLHRPKLANWTSPLLLPRPTGPAHVAIQSGKGILALEVASGKAIWEYTGGASTIPSSTFANGILYTPSHGITALRLHSDQDPEQLWRSSRLRPATPSPVVIEDRVFIINEAGVLTCGSATNGDRLWQLRLQGPFSASPLVSRHRLFGINEKGLLQVVDTQTEEGDLLSTFDLQETILSTPAISQGALYVRSDHKLWKLSAP